MSDTYMDVVYSEAGQGQGPEPVHIHKKHKKTELTLVYTKIRWGKKHNGFTVTVFIQKNGS